MVMVRLAARTRMAVTTGEGRDVIICDSEIIEESKMAIQRRG